MIIHGLTYFTQDDRVEIMSIQQGDVDLHQHEFLELAYVVNGQAIHTLNGTRSTVKKGDYFIINYGAAHKYTLIHQERFDLINVLFQPELIDKSLNNCKSFHDLMKHYLIRINCASLEKNPTDIIFHDQDSAILSIVRNMKEEYDRKEPGYIELIRCHLIEILIRTMRTINTGKIEYAADSSMSEILEYIEQNYTSPITLSEISKRFNFSLPYLCQKFRRDTGYTFSNYLQKRRIELGGRLIANTDKTIAEIAELAGYQDVKYFSKLFKNHWGMSPREFQKKYL